MGITEPCYPSRFMNGMIQGVEDTVGASACHALLHMTEIEPYTLELISDSLDKTVPFQHLSSLNQAFIKMYGPRGGSNIARRVGWSMYGYSLENWGILKGIASSTFKQLSFDQQVFYSLTGLANLLSVHTDQICRATHTPNGYQFTTPNSPFCWEQSSPVSLCHVMVGLLEAHLRWAVSHTFAITEVQCRATGSALCTFFIPKDPLIITTRPYDFTQSTTAHR